MKIETIANAWSQEVTFDSVWAWIFHCSGRLSRSLAS